MLYLPDLNAVFIHVPRCAGTWIKRALAESGVTAVAGGGPGDHNLPQAIYPHYRAAKRFCFVRHPLAWLESAWRGLSGGWPDRRELKPLHRERSWSPMRLLTYTAGAPDFDRFLQNLLAEQPGFVSRMFEWYAGPPGSPAVDYVGRQEHAAADLAAILDALGWRGRLAEVPPVNEGAAPRPLWDVGLRQAVLDSEWVGVRRWYTSPGAFSVTVE